MSRSSTHREPDWQEDTSFRLDPVDELPSAAEIAMAEKLAARHKNILQFVPGLGWLEWVETHWQADKTLRVFDLARAICRKEAVQAKKENDRKAIASAKSVAAVERLARSDRRLVSGAEEWDRDPWLFACQNGVIDLRTDSIRPASPTDYMTKCAASELALGADYPIWKAFLHKVCGGNEELITYLRRAAGYSLTGIVTEHALFFLYGKGANGKSVFLGTLLKMLGSYGRPMPMELLVEAKTGQHQQHPTALAGLRGIRMSVATETQEGRTWNMGLLKALTGGDVLTSRLMRRDFSDFTPVLKPWIMGNHRPRLRRIDYATRRRLNLIPFVVQIPEHERDRDLEAKLVSEWPAILGWRIEGALEWQGHGLCPPPIVKNATDRYFEAEDDFAHWLEERTENRPLAWTNVRLLSTDLRAWCLANGGTPWSERDMTEELENRGFQYKRTKHGAGFYGIQLKPGSPAPEEPPSDPWWKE
jgi:P4 family phage/plasmid primase-like protien